MQFCPNLQRHFSKICKNFTKVGMKKSVKTVPVLTKNMPNSDKNGTNIKPLQENKPFQVLPTPVKSESDKKEYKVIQLDNGLIACLISDMRPNVTSELNDESECEESETDDSSASEESGSEGTEDDECTTMDDNEDEERPKGHKLPEQKMAAAGLCIGVGSFSDPKEVPGMAHFLEHMVFMGSEEFPKENAFDEFIKQNGGSDNASTDAETTVFYFECLEKHLEEALHRFSQFFIAPLMKREAMTREREAIESEFQISLPSDSSRKEQLLCTLAKKNSPVNSFSWGNLITLRDNINDEDLYKGVHEFRKRHYSAHRMTLTVQARMPLEELEHFILSTFSKIPNNGLVPENFTQFYENVFDTPDFNKIYHIIPIKDLCQVDITWALPSLKNKYRSKPDHFLSYLLGDEGKGSLLSYLKSKLWVIGTSIGTGDTGIEHNSLYTFFTVNLNLTDEGYTHINDVIESVFSYLRMLKESRPQQRIFDELQSISNMGFKYAHEESAVEVVENMCEAMQFYPPKDYITGPELYFDFDPESINNVLDQMTPEKANIMVLRHRVNKETESYHTEKWFGTQYAVEDIPKSWMTQWINAPINPQLAIPPQNSFITTDFSILPDIENNPEYPQQILKNSLIESWYRRDTKFKLPMAYYYFYLISPLSVRDAKHTCMLDTLVNLLSIDISEEIYPASSADLVHTFLTYERGLIIKVWGFNEKLPILLNLIVKYLISLSDRITEDMFVAIKDKLLKNYYNKLLKPSGLAKDIRLNLIADNNWHPVERYVSMLDVTFNDMKKFTKDFFKCLYVKALVQGNVTESTACHTINQFVQKLNYTELKKEEMPQYRVVKVNKGERCCRVKSFSKDGSNSIITNYYQSDHYTVENSVIIDLIMMVIEEPLFDILRTKEQLGYHVYCSVRDTFGVLGYTITVNAQATKVTTQFVDERIEAFLKHTQSLLADLDEESFQKVKNNLIKMKQCTDIHLKEEVDRNWSEITSDDYVFDRIKQEIKAIEQTDLKKICSWWETHNSFGNKENFRKLSIQIEGYSDGPKETSELKIQFLGNKDEAAAKENNDYFIKGIQEYKDTVEILNVK